MSIFRFFLIFTLALLIPFAAVAQAVTVSGVFIWGTDEGLFGRDQAGRVETLWSGGQVHKIIPLGQGDSPQGWALLGDMGILVSQDLRNWEPRNQGLPQKVIKTYENGNVSLIPVVQQIKDLEVDPRNPDVMVCTVKNAVFLSQNGGRTWQNLGMPNLRTNGTKAVAVTSMPELTVFASFNINGIHIIHPGTPRASWTELNDGLERLETTSFPDEVSDITITLGSSGPEIYASQSFRLRLYKLDWARRHWNLVWADRSVEFGTVDSLAVTGNSLTFLRDGAIVEVDLSGGNTTGNLSSRTRQDTAGVIRAIPGTLRPNSVALRVSAPQPGIMSLSELWLLGETRLSARAQSGTGKYGIYLPVNHAMEASSLRRYLTLIEERDLNMVVIDMKDDYGRLRFTPENPSMLNLGRVFRPVDLEWFLATMKERGIWTVARIVVFKDPEAARAQGGRYAVWDARNNAPWAGYHDRRRRIDPDAPPPNPALTTQILPTNDPNYEILRTWYDERWVDPYCEIIWEYVTQVSEELCRRGFDEIQWDYIRFPTDGLNLGDARYRWRSEGMDQDSAIMSFLRHARARIQAPISIDIYGANGWYRTGARTGQEVELFTPYVDIICPMYYPSHFEQHFLAHAPPELRPYRIYYQGTRRTHVISRGRAVIRPWAQAFFLNVSYDRQHYGPEYVRMQLDGVRAAGNGGITYWNNLGRYDEVPR